MQSFDAYTGRVYKNIVEDQRFSLLIRKYQMNVRVDSNAVSGVLNADATFHDHDKQRRCCCTN